MTMSTRRHEVLFLFRGKFNFEDSQIMDPDSGNPICTFLPIALSRPATLRIPGSQPKVPKRFPSRSCGRSVSRDIRQRPVEQASSSSHRRDTSSGASAPPPPWQARPRLSLSRPPKTSRVPQCELDEELRALDMDSEADIIFQDWPDLHMYVHT